MDRIYIHLNRIEPRMAFQVLKDTKYGIELCFDNRWIDYPEEWIKELEESLKGCGGLGVHGPYMDLNAGSIEKEIREVTKRRYIRALEICSTLGADSLVLHCGFIPAAYRQIYDLWLRNSVETWTPVARIAEKVGVEIHVENGFEDEPGPIIRLLENLDSESVKVCLDVGHANCFSKTDPLVWIDQLSPWIREMHLHDNDGREDQHLPVGKGTIDFPNLFKKVRELRLKPRLTIEAKDLEYANASARELKNMGWIKE